MSDFYQNFANYNCPKCGQQHAATTSDAKAFVCEKCFTVFNRDGNLISINLQPNYAEECQILQMGDTFTHKNAVYKVTGKLVKRVRNNEKFVWTEYFLSNDALPNIFLVEADGHWTVLEILDTPPDDWSLSMALANQKLNGKDYKFNYEYNVDILFAEGSFGKDAFDEQGFLGFEYINAPHILTAEHSLTTGKNEFYLGEYLFPDRVKKQLTESRNLPTPEGYGSSQPYYWDFSVSDFLTLSLISCVVFFLFQLLFCCVFYPETAPILKNIETKSTDSAKVEFANNIEIPNENALLNTADSAKVELVRNIDVPYDNAILNTVIDCRSLNNDWVGAEMSLVNEETGEEFFFMIETEYYSGVDGGESWTEGSYSNSGVVTKIPKGRYHLEITPFAQAGSPAKTVSLAFSFYKGSWTIFMVFCSILILINAVLLYSQQSFETQKKAFEDGGYGVNEMVDDEDDD